VRDYFLNIEMSGVIDYTMNAVKLSPSTLKIVGAMMAVGAVVAIIIIIYNFI